MRAVRNGTLSVNVAAKNFGTPPSTLKDRISSRIKHGTKSRPTPYLEDVNCFSLLPWDEARLKERYIIYWRVL